MIEDNHDFNPNPNDDKYTKGAYYSQMFILVSYCTRWIPKTILISLVSFSLFAFKIRLL